MTEYKNPRKKYAMKWSFTFMLKRRELIIELKEKIEKLTDGENLPVVEIEKDKIEIKKIPCNKVSYVMWVSSVLWLRFVVAILPIRF